MIGERIFLAMNINRTPSLNAVNTYLSSSRAFETESGIY